jgi:hypothetical protein
MAVIQTVISQPACFCLPRVVRTDWELRHLHVGPRKGVGAVQHEVTCIADNVPRAVGVLHGGRVIAANVECKWLPGASGRVGHVDGVTPIAWCGVGHDVTAVDTGSWCTSTGGKDVEQDENSPVSAVAAQNDLQAVVDTHSLACIVCIPLDCGLE